MLRSVAVTGVVLGLLASAPASSPVAAQESRRVDLMAAFLDGSYLGVVVDDVSVEEVQKAGDARGALVREIEEDSPAAAVGLKVGDLIVGFDGERVRSAAQFARLVRETPVDRKVAIDVRRGGSRESLQVTLAQRDHLGAATDVLRRAGRMPRPHVEPFEFEWHEDDTQDDERVVIRNRTRSRPLKLGVSFQPLTAQLAEHFGVEGGVFVSEVHEGSAAAKAGLKAGDVIVSVAGNQVKDGRSLGRVAGELKPGDEVVLTVQRDGKAQELRLTVGGKQERGAKDEAEGAS